MQHPLWHKIPLVRILIPFVSGIGVSMFTQVSFIPIVLLTIFSTIICLVVHYRFKGFSQRWLWGVCINISIGFWGWSLHLCKNELSLPSHFNNAQQVQYVWVKIAEQPQVKPNSYKVVAEVKEVVDSSGISIVAEGKLMIYMSRNEPAPKYGELYRIAYGLIVPVPGPQNPDEFDYKRYLAFKQIYFQVYLNKTGYVKTAAHEINIVQAWVYGVQRYFKSVLVRCLNAPNEAAVAEALLYGYDDDIDAETMQAYANTGTLHVLAVSGMHVGIIYMILAMLFAPLLNTRKGKWLGLSIILLLLWVYSLLCGFSPSILRATVMFSFIIIADMMEMRSSVYNTLAASAWVLLCYDPNILANVGFQLSYLAVLGIVFFQPFISNWYTAPNWFLHQVWSIIAVSLAAQLITFPIGLLYFHQFPNVFLFSNLVIIPLTTLILYGGIVLLLISKLTWLSWLLGQALASLIGFTNELVKWVEQLPYAYVNGISISITQSMLLYGIIVSVTYFCLMRSRIALKGSLVLGILYASIFVYHQIVQRQQNRLVVYRINKHHAAQLFYGKQSLLIADYPLLNDKAKMGFHLKQHQWKSGVNQLTTLATDSVNWQRFQLGNTIMVVSGNGIPVDTIVCDVLLVKDEHADLSKIKPQKVIITSGVSQFKAKEMLTLLRNRNIDANYVGEKGAIELSLRE